MNTKKPPATNQDKMLTVPVTSEFMDAVRDTAWRERVTVSELVRRSLSLIYPELAAIQARRVENRGRPARKHKISAEADVFSGADPANLDQGKNGVQIAQSHEAS